MDVVLARLVEWIRRYHHRIDHDIASSGVQDLTMAEFQRLCVFELAELDTMVFHDSQSLGGRRLRAALADRWTEGDVDPMMVTHGSSEAIYVVMHTLLEPGDEVVVVDPVYPQRALTEIAAECGAWLVWDHAFGELTYPAQPLPLPRLYERSSCFGTFSKSYGRYQDCARLGFGGSAAEVAAGLAALEEVLATQRQPVPAGTVR